MARSFNGRTRPSQGRNARSTLARATKFCCGLMFEGTWRSHKPHLARFDSAIRNHAAKVRMARRLPYKQDLRGSIPRGGTNLSGVGTLKASGQTVNLLMRVRSPSLTPTGGRVADCSPASEAGKRGFESHPPDHFGELG